MKRQKHSLSHYQLHTGDMGELYPIGIQEVLPGDLFQHSTALLMRVSPLVAPVMHPVQVRVHHFYVPNRLLWSGWEDFITGVDTVTAVPTVTVPADYDTDSTKARLLDYLGVPRVTTSGAYDVSALPVRAYNMVYNEFYRDQDLVTEVSEDSLDIQRIAWEKDRFTSARPWTQKGSAVTVPLGDKAPVTGIGITSPSWGSNTNIRETGATSTQTWPSSANAAFVQFEEDPDNTGYPGVFADLSAATGADIREVRRAFALQKYKEARAMYGSGYVYYLRYLGVRPSDARLQRPEYLGGGKQTISFSEVLQTGVDSADAGVGTMAGHGIAALRSNRYRKFFEEHGFVVTMLSVRPKSIYQEGLHRMWFREDLEDYYQKELEYIGQDEVYKKELFADGSSTDDEVFGYSDRYREYREQPSTVHGEFRNVLDHWHMARQLGAAPTLNQSFIECEPSKRIHAVGTNDVLWIMANHSIQARRMVGRSAPGRTL